MFGLNVKNDMPMLDTREKRAAWENGGKAIWDNKEGQIVEETCEAIKKGGLTYLNEREELFLHEIARSLVAEIRSHEGAKASTDKKAFAKLINNKIFIPLENKFGKLPFIENAREEISPQKKVVEKPNIKEVRSPKRPVIGWELKRNASAAGEERVPLSKKPNELVP